VTLLLTESKMAAKIFEKQHQIYHTTYILQIVLLIIVFNAFIMIIISVNIFILCLISVPYVLSFRELRLVLDCR